MRLKSILSKLHGVVLTEQDVHTDERGWSCQPFSLLHHNWWQNRGNNVHTYCAFSKDGVARGMHWQSGSHPQAKFMQCVAGMAHVCVLDIQLGSPTFGEHEFFDLFSHRTLYVPYGYAAGYTTDGSTAVYYLIHGDYCADSARRCHFPPSDLILENHTMSDGDRNAPMLEDVPKEWLFDYATCDSR